jgi:GNAT superfamily N-acetyltransferase
MSLVRVTGEGSPLAPVFLEMGRDYFSELGIPEERRSPFLGSMLDMQGEPDRWLFLLRHGEDYHGFVHMKIDRVNRPGWGFIMEFYVRPGVRRRKWGRWMYGVCERILWERGVEEVYLSTGEAFPFWSSLGFRETGEIDGYNNLKIMAKAVEGDWPPS